MGTNGDMTDLDTIMRCRVIDPVPRRSIGCSMVIEVVEGKNSAGGFGHAGKSFS